MKSRLAKTTVIAACLVSAILPANAGDAYSSNAPEEVIAAAVERVTQDYANTNARFHSETNRADLAWQLARACFDCADLATNNTQRARFSQEGITAAQAAIAIQPNLAAAYYYLGLNLGQLARTRKLTALGLLDDIESAWTKAIQLDPTYDYAGPHRSIGILYRDAPGWPLSIGDRTKARKHLEQAVKVSSSYPGNIINLLESYLEWGNKPSVKSRLASTQKTLDAAKVQLTGEFWERSWHDWNHRWEKIQSQADVKAISSPRATK